jgi:outer membrane protein assembly factor BamB
MNLAQTISRLSFLRTIFQARDRWFGQSRPISPAMLGLLAGMCIASPANAQNPANTATTPATIRSQSAADWPQILGPNRDGQASLATVASQDSDAPWPSELQINWKTQLGSGFGGSAIVGGQVLTMHREDSKEILEAVSLADGSQLWQSTWPASYEGRINPDEGPRCVPVVQSGKVFCYGAAGDLACVQLSDGMLLWRRSLRREYDADDGYFGAGSTPLAIDGLVIVGVGGKQAGIVAVDQATGKTVWTATNYEASYASPIAVRAANKLLALVVMRLNAVLVDVPTGKVLSEVKFGSRGPTVNAATPIPLGPNEFFLTASYGVGALTLSIDDSLSLVETHRNQSLSSQYNSPVLIGDKIIGINGREDVGMASLRALDAHTQNTIWEQVDLGTANLIALGSHVLALTLPGELSLIDGKQEQYTLLQQTILPTGNYRALPAISGKMLIVRRSMSSAQSELLCIELP